VAVLFIVIALLLPFLAWCVYLLFCAWLVEYTGKAEDLKHAATAARAFPFRPLRKLSEVIPRTNRPRNRSPALTVVPPSESDQSPKWPA